MKKRMIAILLCAVLMFGCSGCGKAQAAQVTPAPTAPPAPAEPKTMQIEVSFAEKTGEFKPVNGINNGPKSGHIVSEDGSLTWKRDATEIYRNLGIPYVRPHDAEYPYGSEMFIDIHCIFPDASRDADDPDAYSFEGSDAYVKNIIDSGAEVFYRLGESISAFDEESKKYLTHLLDDPNKWVDVCKHIIRHYNEGWNNGFEYGIEYWEIWNEPDNSRQWVDSYESYGEFYRFAATILKEEFPELKIGGGVVSKVDEDKRLRPFLDKITEGGAKTPLDFFSWHTYSGHAVSIAKHSMTVREILNEYGYNDTLSVLDEWNYIIDWNDIDSTWDAIHSDYITAFYASVLIVLQLTPVDMAIYYAGDMFYDGAQWCGLYNENAEPMPGIHAFEIFKSLADLKTTAKVTMNQAENGVYALAAANEEGEAGLLITNSGTEPVTIQLRTDRSNVSVNATSYTPGEEFDGRVIQGTTDGDEEFTMSAGQVIYIRYGI